MNSTEKNKVKETEVKTENETKEEQKPVESNSSCCGGCGGE
jgi:hypothetical protein